MEKTFRLAPVKASFLRFFRGGVLDCLDEDAAIGKDHDFLHANILALRTGVGNRPRSGARDKRLVLKRLRDFRPFGGKLLPDTPGRSPMW